MIGRYSRLRVERGPHGDGGCALYAGSRSRFEFNSQRRRRHPLLARARTYARRVCSVYAKIERRYVSFYHLLDPKTFVIGSLLKPCIYASDNKHFPRDGTTPIPFLAPRAPFADL